MDELQVQGSELSQDAAACRGPTPTPTGAAGTESRWDRGVTFTREALGALELAIQPPAKLLAGPPTSIADTDLLLSTAIHFSTLPWSVWPSFASTVSALAGPNLVNVT